MHYLYNNHDHLLVYKDALDQADVRDKDVKISHSNNKKRKRRIKGQHFFTNECKLQLNRMTRMEKNCRVVVTGENCLDYSVIRKYMNTESKVVKVDKSYQQLLSQQLVEQQLGRQQLA